MLQSLVNVIVGSKIRPKQVLRHQGKPWKVLSTVHVKPGKGGAFVQAKIQSLEQGGAIVEERFSSSASIELCYVEERSAQYLYAEGDNSVFMDSDGELLSVATDTLDEFIKLMDPGAEIKVVYCDDKVVDVELPGKINCKIDTVTPSGGGMKYAYARGVRFAVPAYIEVGDEIVVSVETRKFVERARGV